MPRDGSNSSCLQGSPASTFRSLLGNDSRAIHLRQVTAAEGARPLEVTSCCSSWHLLKKITITQPSADPLFNRQTLAAFQGHEFQQPIPPLSERKKYLLRPPYLTCSACHQGTFLWPLSGVAEDHSPADPQSLLALLF